MTPEKFANLTDEELVEFAERNRPTPVFDAFFIGLLVGIIIFGFATSGWFWLAIVPLFLIRQVLRKPKQHRDLQSEMEKRNIKPRKT